MKIQDLFNNYVHEGRSPGTAYIKRVKRNDGDSMLVSSDKWGHKKYWRDSEGGMKKAQEHSKTSLDEDVPCAEPITTDPDMPTSRMIGTDSVVRIFKSKTPGQNSNNVYEHTYNLVSAILAERAPQPPRAPRPTPPPAPRAGVVGRSTRVLGRVAGPVSQVLGVNDDMARKRAEGRQTYGQALGTSTAAAAGGMGGWEAGWRLGMRAPGRLRIPAAIVGGLAGAALGHDFVDSVGERIFHRESIALDESFELAFDYQGKPQLAPTAGQLMMQAKGAFAHHNDVQNVIDVQAIKESIQKQFESTVLEEDTELLAQKCVTLVGMVNTALDAIDCIKESNIERDAWAEAQILKLESYIESVAKYLENIDEDSVPVVRRSYMRTDPRTGQRKKVRGRTYKRRRDFNDDEDEDQDMPKGPRSV